MSHAAARVASRVCSSQVVRFCGRDAADAARPYFVRARVRIPSWSNGVYALSGFSTTIRWPSWSKALD
ncbi:hypothetical protein NFJ02_10g01170 [Pycnococcus provasolii]